VAAIGGGQLGDEPGQRGLPGWAGCDEAGDVDRELVEGFWGRAAECLEQAVEPEHAPHAGAAEHRGAGDDGDRAGALREGVGSGEGVGRAAGHADDGEGIEIQGIGERLKQGRPAGEAAAWLRGRSTDAWPVGSEQECAGAGGGLVVGGGLGAAVWPAMAEQDGLAEGVAIGGDSQVGQVIGKGDDAIPGGNGGGSGHGRQWGQIAWYEGVGGKVKVKVKGWFGVWGGAAMGEPEVGLRAMVGVLGWGMGLGRDSLVAICGLLWGFVGGGASGLEEVTSPGWEGVGEVVEAGLEGRAYPGAVVVVGQVGRVIWAKAYGTTSYGEGAREMALDAVFDLASVTKVVATATAALLLVEDGVLDLDGRVGELVEGFGEGGKGDVRVRDLLVHGSGLKAYESRGVVEAMRREGESPADALLRAYAALRPSYEAGWGQRYSCLNFQVLSRAIEGAAGVRMEELLRVRVYGPLGMRDTGYRLGKEQRERAVPTARRPDGTDLVGSVHDPLADYHGIEDHSPGNAGLFSTAGDLARYCEMWLGGGQRGGRRVFSPSTLHLAASEQTPPGVGDRRGLGWDIYEAEGYATALNRRAGDYVIGHAGFTGTLVWMDLRSRTYLIFLSNRTYPYEGEMGEGEERMGIGTVRRRLAEAVLRALPDDS
jgi:serine-type D-Ala-D-Ala carboxypeptidase